jgi:hypothetical protein
MNHVVALSESIHNAVRVQMTTLDELLRQDEPTLLKVDVEGFETEVFDGATKTLAAPSLLAMIVELNRSGDRYGANQEQLIQKFEHFGFRPYEYLPFERELRESIHGKSQRDGNTLFVRRPEIVVERVRSAPRISVFGTLI